MTVSRVKARERHFCHQEHPQHQRFSEVLARRSVSNIWRRRVGNVASQEQEKNLIFAATQFI